MKPSARIHAIAQEQQTDRVAHDGSYVLDAAAIVAYLDEQHEQASVRLAACAAPKPVIITTPEEWRAYHGDYPPPSRELTDPVPVNVYVGDRYPLARYPRDASEPEQ